jgi:outer membrane receptor protein involved in Fe transport
MALFEALGYSPYRFYNLAAIVEGNYSINNTSLVGGIRADYREFFGLAISPRVGVVQKLGSRHTLRSTFSTAYRPPSSYLIYSGLLGISIDSLRLAFPSPNDSLQAERLFNVDLGWYFQVTPSQSFDFSAFFHKKYNLISRTNQSLTPLPGLFDYYGFVSDNNALASLIGLQLEHRATFKLGTMQVKSSSSVQYAAGSEVLPFGRGTLSRYREQPDFTAKWLIEVEPVKHIYVSARIHYFSNWITRSVVVPQVEDLLTAPSFTVVDASITYRWAAGQEVYLLCNNLFNTYYYGIGASGGAGIFANSVIFEDVFFNPQLLRVLKVGIRIAL